MICTTQYCQHNLYTFVFRKLGYVGVSLDMHDSSNLMRTRHLFSKSIMPASRLITFGALLLSTIFYMFNVYPNILRKFLRVKPVLIYFRVYSISIHLSCKRFHHLVLIFSWRLSEMRWWAKWNVSFKRQLRCSTDKLCNTSHEDYTKSRRKRSAKLSTRKKYSSSRHESKQLNGKERTKIPSPRMYASKLRAREREREKS